MKTNLILTLVFLISCSSTAADWTGRMLEMSESRYRTGKPLDIDGDGDLDILGQIVDRDDYYHRPFYWWENNVEQEFVRHSIQLIDLVPSILCHVAADLDGDGDVDIALSNGYNEIYWMENDGSMNFEPHVIQEDYYTWPIEIEAVDVDGDQDIDILTAGGVGSTQTIQVFLNNGTGEFTHFILRNVQNRPSIVRMRVVDMNNDGRMDIVIGSSWIDIAQVVWFEYNDNGSLREHFVHELSDLRALDVGDLDGDGDEDIVAGEDVLRVYENDGNGSFVSRVLDADSIQCGSAAIGDYDGDGDQDIAVVDYNNGSKIVLYENSGNWTCERKLEKRQIGADNVWFADIDQNGTSDIFAGGSEMHWYRLYHQHEAHHLQSERFPQSNQVLICWTVAEGPDREFIEYQLFRDGELTAATTDTSFTDTLPDRGYYTYEITTIYADGEVPALRPSFLAWRDLNWQLFADFNNGLPPGWERHSLTGYGGETTTVMWMNLEPNEFQAITSPHMVARCNGFAEGGHLLEGYRMRLYSKPIAIEAVSLARLLFTHVYLYELSSAEIAIRNKTLLGWSNWENLDTYSSARSGIEEYDLDFWLAGADSLQCRFTLRILEDSVWPMWAIDDVRIEIEYPDQPLSVAITPQNTIIPEEGGTLTYDLDFTYTMGNTLPNCHYWTEVELPDGTMHGPLFTHLFALQPFMNASVTGLTQDVPADAPAGTYTFTGTMGYRINEAVQVSDSFEFVKEGVSVDGSDEHYTFDPTDWATGGDFDIAGEYLDQTAELPTQYTMNAAYPNPFNASTTINVSLPEAADLMVTVYNVTGQQVAELANGQFDAGSHNLTFDASGMASGLYFVRANVPGLMDQTLKVMLVR
jgi:FG-GAP-like repeat/Secretion system C-terminal sorting domain